ncbi:MAG: hypothetical protein M3033_03695 [Acidobacteriota bacterium]|nr:hypothetical protein [Acidobacteriota bacterium]
MKQNIKLKKICVHLCLSAVSILLFLSSNSFAQTVAASTAPLLKRTAYKTETIDFGAGGTVSIVGAPAGSITVEGWQKNSVEVSAEVEVQAGNESDLALLAGVNTFVIDNDFGHIRIQTVGTYDKGYMKRAAKKFPKNLLNMPFRVDYHIKVPIFCDLEIDGGRGDLNLSNVDGSIQIKVLESNAKFNLIGGTINATIGGGNVDVTIPAHNWRGRNVDVQLAKGNMNVFLPLNLNANVDAAILRTGQIENAYKPLVPRVQRAKFTDKSIVAKSGAGGAALSFTVGDGALKIAAVEN